MSPSPDMTPDEQLEAAQRIYLHGREMRRSVAQSTKWMLVHEIIGEWEWSRVIHVHGQFYQTKFGLGLKSNRLPIITVPPSYPALAPVIRANIGDADWNVLLDR